MNAIVNKIIANKISQIPGGLEINFFGKELMEDGNSRLMVQINICPGGANFIDFEDRENIDCGLFYQFKLSDIEDELAKIVKYLNP